MSEKKKIGIVLTCINLWDKYTKPALDSIKSNHDLYFVIVDNGSTDNTQVEAMKLVNENFHYKKFNNNEGLTKAWNYGLHDCFDNHACDYVFLPNNDVLFHEKTIDLLVDRFEKKDEDVVMVTAMNIASECETPQSIFTKDIKEKENIDEAESPDFSGFMVNKKFWEEIGEFDNGFSEIGRAYFEDGDMHRRIKLSNLKAIVLPQAIYYHFGSRTQIEGIQEKITIGNNSAQEEKHKRFEANRNYFIEKWGGTPEPDGKIGERLWKRPFNNKNFGINISWQDLKKRDELKQKFNL